MNEQDQQGGTPEDRPKDEDGAFVAVVTGDSEGVGVELPTLGRFVHLRIDANEAEPLLRPLLVLEAQDGGLVTGQVFLLPDDLPYAPGSGIRRADAIPGAYFATVPFGHETGEWRWPDYPEPIFFTASV